MSCGMNARVLWIDDNIKMKGASDTACVINTMSHLCHPCIVP